MSRRGQGYRAPKPLEHLEVRALLASPIVITAGGTYSGTWESFDPNVPAVSIQTSAPVIIENSIIRGRGDLIRSSFTHNKITVRNTSGFGLNPNVYGESPGRFFDVENFDSATITDCYLEGTAGIYMLNYAGNRTTSQSIKILDNEAKNIDGRMSNGAGGWIDFNERTGKRKRSTTEEGADLRQFVQFDKVLNVPGIEIAWNQVINEPGNSRVEDNINIYKSSGTPSSPIIIHNNYIQGAYTIKPWQDDTSDGTYNYDWGFSGGGILLGDGVGSTAASDPAYIKVFDNQVVSTTNYGIAIAAGHDMEFFNNRVVSSGRLPDGRVIANQNVGIYVWDSYGIGSKRFYNNISHDNLVGWVQGSGRNDWWSPDPSTVNSNTRWPGAITLATEAAEFALWQSKLAGHRAPPSAPENLVATAISPGRANLSWSNVLGETGYKIERSLNGADDWAQIGATGADQTTFADLTVAANTSYAYRVRASNASGDSDYSLTASATTPYTPAAPTDLAADTATFDHVDLSWIDHADNETGFKIERSLDGVGGWNQIAVLNADTLGLMDTVNIVPGTTYFYRIRATHPTGGDSDYSNLDDATTIQIAPAAPSNLVAAASSHTQINLTWTDNANNEASFILERSPDGVNDWTLLATPPANATSYSDIGLTPLATWHYRIRATNSAGDSIDSDVASATTLAEPTMPNAPSDLTAVAVSHSQINLTWADNANDETGFVIERSLDGVNNWTQIATPAANASSFNNNSGLSPLTTYFYRVRAVNAVGPSIDSDSAFATTLAAPVPALPSPWIAKDIGTTGIAGSGNYSNGVFTVKGGGADIWGSADSFNFVYIPWTGNGQIIARVTSVQAVTSGSHGSVMIRNTLDANSKHVTLGLSASGTIGFVRRTATSGSSSVTTASGGSSYYVKLIRNGSTFTAYRSSNGTSWTKVGSSATISMNATVFVGLTVCSKIPGTLCTATFSNVTTSTSTSSALAPGSGVFARPSGSLLSSTSTSSATSMLKSDDAVLK